MDYEEVVGKLQKYGPSYTLQDVETLLGYLYYEEESIEELLPIEFSDMEEILSHTKQVAFSLHDGEDFSEALTKIMNEIDFTKSRNIDTMVVKFIGGSDLDVDTVYQSFSPLEFGMNSSGETSVLIAATIDHNLKDRVMAIVMIAAEEEF